MTQLHNNQDALSYDTESIFSSVLLIESDPILRKNYATTLEPLVGEIVPTRSGEQALEAIETQYFELAILSLNIEDISAQHLLSSIHVLRPTLSIIVVACENSLEEALRALRDGASDYIMNRDSNLQENECKQSLERVAESLMANVRELELKSERNAFWGAVQTAAGAMAIVNPNGLISFTNPAFHDFLSCIGVSKNAQSQLNIIKTISTFNPTVARQLSTALREYHSGDSHWESEFSAEATYLGGEKRERYFHLSLSFLSVDTQNGSSLIEDRRQVLWITDVSDRKDYEKFQRDVLSTTTHDLKGPLGTVLCAAELILDDEDELNDEVVGIVRRIESSAQKALDHIEEFLSERRLEDGAILVNPKQLLLQEIIEDAVNDYSMVAKDRGIDLQAKPLDPYALVYAEGASLSRVLSNIISNAIKFTPLGGKVTISGEVQSKMTCIQISDTGPGIEPEARRSLFDRYSRLEKHKDVKGTGLGLFIVKTIIEAHGGRIEVESELGAGTTFIIYLPNREDSLRNNNVLTKESHYGRR